MCYIRQIKTVLNRVHSIDLRFIDFISQNLSILHAYYNDIAKIKYNNIIFECTQRRRRTTGAYVIGGKSPNSVGRICIGATR